MSSEWCQNKKCPDKKNQNQIRGIKGHKYYQSNKSSSYYEYWCSMGCRDAWWIEHKNTCIRAVGLIDKQTVNLDDAWYVEYRYDYTIEPPYRYHLINRLKGIDQSILQTQAQTRENIQQYNFWSTISDNEARELAVTLGLAS
jgi:hypothetical protein